MAQALRDGAPVVALESTIISHGMPYPQNVAMAREVEGIVRDLGAVPATIAVLDGRPRIGLGDDDLELLGSHPDVTKVSVRDLPSSSPAAPTAPPPSPRRCGSPRWPGSGSS